MSDAPKLVEIYPRSNCILVPMKARHLLHLRRIVTEIDWKLDEARKAVPVLNAMSDDEVRELREALSSLG